MATRHRVFLFGDQVFQVDAPLRSLLSQKSPLLVSFFERSFFALRRQIQRLPPHIKQSFPRFSSIADLLSRARDGCINTALEQCLCLIHHFAAFISQHSEGRLPYPSPADSHILGLCTGTLAAAAISCSKDLSELVPLAVHTVIVALHVGLRAHEVGRSLDAKSSTGSWSVVVAGISKQQAESQIKDFCAQNAINGLGRPYISALTCHGLTITAPPSVLALLRNSEVFGSNSAALIPIHAPYHAPHLYSKEDVNSILSSSSTEEWSSFLARTPVLSCRDGSFVWTGTYQSTLTEALGDVLLHPIDWQKTQDRLVSLIASSEISSLDIVQTGTSLAHGVERALKPYSQTVKVFIKDGSQQPLEGQRCPHGRTDKSKIAVVGMAGRFPGAVSHHDLWQLLENQRDMCKEVPPLRWDVKTHVDPTGKAKNTSKIRWGCWLDDPDLFDARFFNMSPREAPQVDPAQRLALLTAYEAMEQGGIVPGRTPSTREDRVGVFYGTTSNDWCEMNSGQDVDTYYIPGANRAFIPGRINYVFKFSGPSYSVDTACSSSLSAIHNACNSLWRGDIDMAIAGGTNVLTNPDMTTGLDKGHFLSESGNCKTFDDTADGYCRGEGVATVILKRLEDAIEDKDPINGVILSAYTNHSAEAESITRPHVGAQKDIFERVLNDSGTDPYDVGYIEMHGTGTQAGDSREMRSVLDTFAPENSPMLRGPDRPLHLGAIKANIGHGESVSGVSALIKVMMMMQKNSIPANIGIKTKMNTHFPPNLADRNVHIDLEQTSWQKISDSCRKAIINNFSAAGGNSSILVEEPSTTPPVVKGDNMLVDIRPTQPIAFSAKSHTSLKSNMLKMLGFLNSSNCGSEQLPCLSYTTTARRMHHFHRVVVEASSLAEATSKLEIAIATDAGAKRSLAPKGIVFAFTGQGAQYAGMGKELFQSSSVFRQCLLHFDHLVQRAGFSSVLPLFTASANRSISEFSPTVVQLANTCMQIGLAKVWTSWGIFPSAVIGHSLGEYAALNVAGVISDVDTIYLVGRRAQLMQDQCQKGTHAMLAVLSSLSSIQDTIPTEQFEVACINGPEETVLAGPKTQIDAIQTKLSGANLKTKRLEVPYAFHSSQIAPILSSFEAMARGITFHRPSVPVISPLLGTVIQDCGIIDARYLARHCRETVNIHQSLLVAKEEGVLNKQIYAMEFGPHPVVSGMISSSLGPAITVLPTLRRNKNPWEILAQTASTLYTNGLDLNWNEYHRDFPSAQIVLDLPTYGWDLKSYWIKYRNDWTLTKGDIGHTSPASPSSCPSNPPAVTSSTASKTQVPRIETTTVHRIQNEKHNGQSFEITLESNVSRPDLNPLVQGHKVEGIPLCTPSVYADIAFTIGKYLLDRFEPPFIERTVDVTDMVIEKALIAHNNGTPQLLRTTAAVDWQTKQASCRFFSVDNSGNETVQHSTCRIHFVDDSLRPKLQAQLPKIQERFQQMKRNSNSGKTYRFNGAMAYNMVSKLADFHDDYKCIDETILDNDSLEAACTVSFGGIKKGGVFHTHPGYIDGLTQSGGFIMNANDKVDLNTTVHVNHGWDTFQIFENIDDRTQYCTHVRMQSADNNQHKGDILVFTEDRVVAYVGGVCLQGAPRRVLSYILKTTAKECQPKAEKQTPTKSDRKPAATTSSSRSDTTNLTKQMAETSLTVPVATSSIKTPDDIPRQTPGLTSDSIHIPQGRQSAKIESASVQAAAPVTSTAHAPKSQSSLLACKAIDVICEESGIERADLSDDTLLADVGVDSLLSLVIGGRLREELELDLDMESLFSEWESIGDVKAYFAASQDPDPSLASPEASTTEPVTLQLEEAQEKNTELSSTTPAFIRVSHPTTIPQPASDIPAPVSNSQMGGFSTSSSNSDDPAAKITSVALGIIADEVRVPVDDLHDDVTLTDIGIDSLLNLVIGSRFHEELDMEIDTETMFADIATIGDLKKYLGGDKITTPSESSFSSSLDGESQSMSETSGAQSFDLSTPFTEMGSIMTPISSSKSNPRTCAPTTSVVLQGSLKTATHTLFLFPDGSGSATSYSSLSRMGRDVAVVGLNSPYLKNGEDLTCSFDELVASYLTEVRNRQPQGPYHFGGWSAGGSLAYRAAQFLLAAGEMVNTLILLDAPVPEGLGTLPQHFFDYCEQTGLIGSAGKTPPWLIPHFRSMNRVLSSYIADPLTTGRIPKVLLMWATQSVFHGQNTAPLEPRPGDPEDMQFLTQARVDYSAGRWARLFPGINIDIARAEGCNHFDMLRGDHALKVCTWIAEALT